MAITIRTENLAPGLEEKLGEIFDNKTTGGEIIIDSFLYLRRDTLQELKGIFTKEELTGLIALRNGTIFEPQFSCNAKFLLAELEDAEKFDNQSKNFSFDYKKLIAKIQKLTSAQVYFLLLEINRFWNKESAKENSLDDFIKKII